MRLITLYIIAAISAFALPNPTSRTSSIGLLEVDELGHPHGHVTAIVPPRRASPVCSTNAECLRLGLPILPQANGRSVLIDPAVSSRPTIYRRGKIAIVNARSGDVVGYLSKTFSASSLYAVTEDELSAAIVSFDAAQGVEDLNIISNADTAFPYLCGVRGPASTSEEISTGSYNYGFLAACAEPMSPNTPPALGSNKFRDTLKQETAILDPADELSVQWTNPDLSQPATFLIYAPSLNALTFTGDVAAYQVAFGPDRFQVVYRLDFI